MKILMLTPYLPYPLLSGGQIRTYNLLKQLATKHEITLFALIKDYQEEQHIKEIEPFCKQVRVFKRSKQPFTARNIIKTAFSTYPFLVMRNHVSEAVTAIKQELNSNKYDLIHAETFYMMPHIPQTSVPILLVEQTIEYLGYQSYAQKNTLPIKWLLNQDIKKIIRWEKHYWSKAKVLVTMSENDKKFIQKHIKSPEKVKVVSNGVDSIWFSKKKHQLPIYPTILYVGTFKWLPNVEAVEYLIEKVWPILKKQIPNVRLNIAGNAPTKKIRNYARRDTRINVLGRIEDIRDAFTSSHVLLAPVLSGKGTRYKILEAMACGTPIVATKTAVEGLNLSHNQDALISDVPDQMAAYTQKLIEDKILWKRLSKNGQEYVKKNFDWKMISAKLDKIYQSMG